MTHPDAQRAFEEMMPEAVAYRDRYYHCDLYLSPGNDREPLHTADQLRTAMQAVWDAATERAAKACETERIDEIHEGDLIYNEAVDKCAAAIRSSGRGEG